MTITLNAGTNQALLAINNGPDSKMIRKALEATLEDVAQVTRDASGNVVGLSAGGRELGARLGASTIIYDSQGRVATHDNWTLTYDAAGRASSQTNGTQTQTFNYDTDGRFTGITEV